uniref:Uncharacterized protein n=1 Tax=Klebsiella pneumoniae TaxID=573 RepID=A0A223LMQ0_KLEPN|nr:Hypothetical protein [Klebsiella pneumoniae]
MFYGSQWAVVLGLSDRTGAMPLAMVAAAINPITANPLLSR